MQRVTTKAPMNSGMVAGDKLRYVGLDFPAFRSLEFKFCSYGWDKTLANLIDSTGEMHMLMPVRDLRFSDQLKEA